MPLNMAIWHVTLSGFAKAVGAIVHAPRTRLSSPLHATLHKLCAWPAAEAKDERVLLDFWPASWATTRSEDEYVAWRDFFLRDVQPTAGGGDHRRHDAGHHHEPLASCCTSEARADASFSRRDVLRLGAARRRHAAAAGSELRRGRCRARRRSAFLPADRPRWRRRFLLHVRCAAAGHDRAPARSRTIWARSPAPGSAATAALRWPRALVKPLRPSATASACSTASYMTPSFDGHLQNMNFLFSGNPFGGDSFIPHLNSAETGREPGFARRHRCRPSPVSINVNNHSGVVPLEPNSLEQLAERLRQAEPPRSGDRLGRLHARPPGGQRERRGAHVRPAPA